MSRAMEQSNSQSSSCCGAHLVCEREWEVRQPEIVYYDDEELDSCAHRSPDSYSADEIERFAYVLDTMLESDVPGWIHSLQQRDIQLPTSVRDRVMLYL